MKNKILILPPMILLMTACTNTLSNNNGLIDQENINIITDINSLAIDTFFDSGKETVDEMIAEIESNTKPTKKSDIKEDIIKNVEPYASIDPKAKWVYDNFFNITNVEAYLTGNDPDTIEFVYNLNHGITDFTEKSGESVKLDRSTPFYLQWDNRWGYNDLYPRNIGISGCGPTSMAMILARLEDDDEITPSQIAVDAKNYMNDDGISWNFFADEAAKYNYSIRDINLDENEMIEALKEGPLLVSVNRGYFTLFGHIFVIDSYKDGKFIVNDPNSIKNTLRPWSFDEMKDQIAHIWLIS